MRTTTSIGIALAAFLAATTVPSARAQSLGIELGVSAVENHDPAAPTVGISLAWPMTDRLEGSLGYTGWFGRDGNRDDASLVDADFFGNHALVLGVLGRAWGDDHGEALLGAGLGQVERIHRVDGRERSRMDGTLVLSGVVRRALGERTRVYVRGDLAAPTGYDTRPRWGFLRLGVDLEL